MKKVKFKISGTVHIVTHETEPENQLDDVCNKLLRMEVNANHTVGVRLHLESPDEKTLRQIVKEATL